MSVERHCFCCNRPYFFCGQGCKNEDASQTWRFLFDSKNCLDAYNLWQAYRGKEIQEHELRAALNKIDIDVILASDTQVAQDFRAILKKEEDIRKNIDVTNNDENTNHPISVSTELKRTNSKKKIVPKSQIGNVKVMDNAENK